MIAKTQQDIDGLRAAGKILSGVLLDTAKLIKDGVSTAELDLAAEHTIRARGATPSFLNYLPDGASYPYPASLCVSINDEVVHGIPSEKRILRSGDMVSIDAGLLYKGYYVDAARTVMVGAGDPAGAKLIAATEEALAVAIAVVRPGKHIGDIGAAVMRVAAKHTFAIVQELGGHAVGRAVHEQPFIANEGREGEGETIVEGMVLALEPMLCEGKGAISLAPDEWTYVMRDGKRAAHAEDTILVTKNGAEILTR